MNANQEVIAARRKATYVAVSVVLCVGYLRLRTSTWTGSAELHTLMEVAATLLALLVGVMALVRFYSRKTNLFLFVGTGFLGTGFLDGYHGVVSSTWFAGYLPSDLGSLIPWSWIASRLFLSIFLWISWLAWKREARLGAAGRIREGSIYAAAIALTLGSFCLLCLRALAAGPLQRTPVSPAGRIRSRRFFPLGPDRLPPQGPVAERSV